MARGAPPTAHASPCLPREPLRPSDRKALCHATRQGAHAPAPSTSSTPSGRQRQPRSPHRQTAHTVATHEWHDGCSHGRPPHTSRARRVPHSSQAPAAKQRQPRAKLSGEERIKRQAETQARYHHAHKEEHRKQRTTNETVKRSREKHRKDRELLKAAKEALAP